MCMPYVLEMHITNIVCMQSCGDERKLYAIFRYFMHIYAGCGSVMQMCGKRRVLVVTVGIFFHANLKWLSFLLANFWWLRERLCKLLVTSKRFGRRNYWFKFVNFCRAGAPVHMHGMNTITLSAYIYKQNSFITFMSQSRLKPKMQIWYFLWVDSIYRTLLSLLHLWPFVRWNEIKWRQHIP